MNTVFYSKNNILCNHFVLKVSSINLEKHFRNDQLVPNDPSDPNFISIEEILEWSGEKLCKTIGTDYILSELENADIVILSSSINTNKTRSKQLSKRLCGFSILSIKKDYLYVSIICALPGVGGKMIKFVEKVALQMKKKKIKLDSLDAPIGFYLKNGYTFNRGDNTFEINESYFPEYSIPKKILNPPPNYDKEGTKIDIGYIHTESYGGHRFYWILVIDNQIRRWKMIKPGYIFLNKIGTEVKNYLLTRKPSLLMPYETKTKAGTQKKYLNAGMITTIRNIKVKDIFGDSKLVSMTKIL